MKKVLLILACMLLVFGLAASAAADSILQTMQEAETGWMDSGLAPVRRSRIFRRGLKEFSKKPYMKAPLGRAFFLWLFCFIRADL